MSMFQINPGKYKHIIHLQKLSDTQNEYGEVEDEETKWVDVAKSRAGIFPLSGKEFLSADKEFGEVTHKIHIRFIPNIHITSDMRIKFGQRIFQLTVPPINFQEQNKELQLMCKELF